MRISIQKLFFIAIICVVFSTKTHAQYSFGFDLKPGYDNFNNYDTSANIEIAFYNTNQDSSTRAVGGTVFANNGTAIDTVHFRFNGPKLVVFPKGTYGYRNVQYLKINPIADSTFYGQRYFYLVIDNLLGILKSDLNFGLSRFTVILDYDGKNIGKSGYPKISIAEYSMYPNPTRDFLNISGVDIIQYSILDYSGKTVLSGIPEMNQIDVSHLPAGMYILQSLSNKGHLLQKFVKE